MISSACMHNLRQFKMSAMIASAASWMRSKAGRYVVALLCIAVFLLVLNARLSVYQSDHFRLSNAGSSTTLLIADQKMEVRAIPVLIPTLCLAVALLLALSRPVVLWSVRPPEQPVRVISERFELHRYLRPPPSF